MRKNLLLNETYKFSQNNSLLHHFFQFTSHFYWDVISVLMANSNQNLMRKISPAVNHPCSCFLEWTPFFSKIRIFFNSKKRNCFLHKEIKNCTKTCRKYNIFFLVTIDNFNGRSSRPSTDSFLLNCLSQCFEILIQLLQWVNDLFNGSVEWNSHYCFTIEYWLCATINFSFYSVL